MWILSTLLSLISVICYFNNIDYLLIIGSIIVIVDNYISVTYGNQNNFSTLFLTIFLGFLYSLFTSSNILITICLFICCGNLIEGILGILLLIFGVGLYKQNSKIICQHCNSKNNPKRENCYMCGKKLHEEQNTDYKGAYQQFLQDNFSNDGTKTYINDIKVKPNEIENNLNDSKLNYLLDILKREINVKDVNDAINQLYKFYVDQGIDIPSGWISYSKTCSENPKLEILLNILQTGMGTNNVDDTIEGLEKFYKKQHDDYNLKIVNDILQLYKSFIDIEDFKFNFSFLQTKNINIDDLNENSIVIALLVGLIYVDFTSMFNYLDFEKANILYDLLFEQININLNKSSSIMSGTTKLFNEFNNIIKISYEKDIKHNTLLDYRLSAIWNCIISYSKEDNKVPTIEEMMFLQNYITKEHGIAKSYLKEIGYI